MNASGQEPRVRFSREDVFGFAGWSADLNPLHVDPEYARHTHFGQQVVHGVLTVLETLRSGGPPPSPVRTLDIEFRTAVFIGESYVPEGAVEGDEFVLKLKIADQVVLGIRAGTVAVVPEGLDLSWVASATRAVRDTPAERSIEELQPGTTATGSYAAAVPQAGLGERENLSATGARVLALCSYVTGMEVPGLKSLFTRITLALHADVPSGAELRYRARTTRFDPKFRLLDTELTVATADGRVVATGLLRSYVPFSPRRADLSLIADRLSEAAGALLGKVALVTGGSRGLGADIASALALAGGHVYVSARHDDEDLRVLQANLSARGAHVDFVQGDAGDPAWCAATLDAIRARHGRLDLLVLNACAPPATLRLDAASEMAFQSYVQSNVRLVTVPVSVFSKTLSEVNGATVYVSSSAVDEPPVGWSHYVAVKQVGEAVVRTLSRELPNLFTLIARPPALQTTWSDTPSRAVGSIPADWAASHIVNALSEQWAPGAASVLTQFPQFAGVPRTPTGAPQLSIRLAVSFTADPLVPALRFWTKELALDAGVQVAPYGQVMQSLLDPSSALNDRGRGANVVLLRVRDWLRELPDEQLAEIDRIRQHLLQTVGDFEAAVRAHRGQAAAETLLVLCPSYGASSSAESILVHQAEDSIVRALSGMPGLQVIAASQFHEHYRVDEDDVHDALRDDIAHIPYRDDYLHVLAAIVARHVYRRFAPVRKVVVVDCDNTLWRGVVGEVGPEGVEFDAGHRALHETLTRLTENGVLVCLCSKNEEPDVWRVFETRADFGLRRDHVVAAMINWLPKSQNIRTLAGRLNLGLDSFVFLDDNPVECAEVRAGCPEVLTVQWPQDADRAEQLTKHIWEFDGGKATKEDARRTALYQEEFRRQELRAETLTFDDFIKNLQLEVDFAPLGEEDLRRSAQLTLRTNQFNFTTIRREEADVQALAADGQHDIRTVRVRDRFGDYGLVGLVILERGDQAWTLDTFLLSCRVLGRGVEHRILSEVGRMAGAEGASRVRMRVESTKRNTPARSFLESAVPAQYRSGDAAGVRADVPVDALAAVHFEPAAAGEVVIQDEGSGTKVGSQPVDTTQLRRREEQIARAAFELASGAAIRAAAEGRELLTTIRPAGAVTASEGDIAAVVHGAFAAALRVSVERVAQVDRLEALGCDSLRIVEITVALSEQYPWLPSTLLFEHQAVSQIVQEIVRMSQPQATSASAQARGRAVLPAVRRTDGDIAVVGVGVRCAGAGSPDELWELLRSGRSAVRPVPPDRSYFLRPLVDERPHWAGLLEDVGRFDPEFFGVSPREAEVMDPQLRLFLEVAWSALEDAGAVGASLEPETGVFAGVMYGDYGYRANAGSTAPASPYRCWEGFSLANRLSQLLGLHGPSLAVDTACSSSATALHIACTSLRAGECKAAVVGGVNLILDPDRFASLGRLGILSPRGVCEPFGADADGTVLGEGAGVVVLRPLADALARGSRIYGVIKGTGLSTGSGTVGFTAPNPLAQSQAIRRSLQVAGVDPRTVSYVESHGTGTLLGDPIEVRGLTLAYTDTALQDPGVAVEHRCALGSIKPNVGHLEAGAGVLGLIKVLLQFKHQALLPSLTSAQPSAQIPFGQVPFVIQRELAPWTPTAVRVDGQVVTVPRRAGLNSFGVGGANAHLIVEEPPTPAAQEHRSTQADRPLHVLALSGVTDAALARQIQQVAEFAEATPGLALADVCYALNTGRKHLTRRTAVVAGRHEELLLGLHAAAERRSSGDGAPPKVAFLFTGQGSQYVAMGHAFYDTQPVFRDALDQCAKVLDALLDRPLRELLFASDGSDDASLLNQTGYTQPALFAVQYALAQMWRSWGISPHVVMGHSVGEIAAMCVAGGLSLDHGLTLVAARGRLMQALPVGGVMTSVMADEARVQAAIENVRDTVAIAAVNAPGQVVISGAEAAVAEISARLTADGIKTRALTVSHAFHSPLMKPMLADYERVVRSLKFSAPVIPLVTCVDGAIAGEELTRPDYWLRQVMEPVRFVTGMKVLEAEGVGAYVEIGPHPVLIGMGRQCVVDESQSIWVPSLRKGADPWRTILDGVGRLYEHGADVDWHRFDAPYRRARVSVPAYAFGEREYWLRHVPVLGEVEASSASVQDTPDSTSPQSYELAWQAQPAPTPKEPTGHWMLLADHSGVGSGLAAAIEAGGGTATVVEAGPEFLRQGRRFQIDPSRREHYEQLWAATSGERPTRIVHLWNLDSPSNEALAPAVLNAALLRGVSSITALVQSLAEAGTSRPRLTVVTRGAAGVADDSTALSLAQAPAWGFGRTVSLEHPELWAGLIDLEPGDSGDVAQRLASELMADSPEDQVALRRRGRFVARLVSAEGLASGSPSFSREGAYLVTGGLGALGLQSAQWLVAHGARHLVLTSRTANASRARTAIAALEAQGATVEVVEADVSSIEAVDALLGRVAAAGHPLRGIVHAAGLDTIVPVSRLRETDLLSVFAAKGTGAWLLHARTRELNLDLFLCFSSVAAVLGSQGRAHYAAANAFLDGLALERHRLGLPTTTVNWGPWRGGGMATEEHLRQFERIGNRGLDPSAALRALDSAVAGGRHQAIIADFDWDVFKPAFEARRARPVLAAVGAQSLAEAGSVAGTAAAPWVQRLSGVAEADRESTLVALVQRELAETMGFDDADSVPAGRNFYELGVDSLMMADLVGRIRKQVGFSCSTLIFEHPTARDFSRQLLSRLPMAHQASVAQVDPEASGNPDAVRAEFREVTTGYQSAAEDQVFAFQAVAWPHRDQSLIPSRWRWMFVESARRLALAPRVWLHRASGQIVGHMGSIPVKLKVGSETLNTGWLVDTMVTDDYRRRGLGSRLLVQAHDDQPFSLSLGQTAEAREILHHLGWHRVAPLEIAQLLIRPANVLRGKLPRPAAVAAGWGLRASATVRGLVRGKSRLCLKEVAQFDARHDRLWESVAATMPCAVVRDASYLNWKYVDQPGQAFVRIEAIEGDRVCAVAVMALREPDAVYRYRRALLVDIVAPQSGDALLQQIVQAAADVADARGADVLRCLHIGSALTRALKAVGFTMRTPERHLLVDAASLPAPTRDLVIDASNWFVTQGDSDIDRPW